MSAPVDQVAQLRAELAAMTAERDAETERADEAMARALEAERTADGYASAFAEADRERDAARREAELAEKKRAQCAETVDAVREALGISGSATGLVEAIKEMRAKLAELQKYAAEAYGEESWQSLKAKLAAAERKVLALTIKDQEWDAQRKLLRDANARADTAEAKLAEAERERDEWRAKYEGEFALTRKLNEEVTYALNQRDQWRDASNRNQETAEVLLEDRGIARRWSRRWKMAALHWRNEGIGNGQAADGFARDLDAAERASRAKDEAYEAAITPLRRFVEQMVRHGNPGVQEDASAAYDEFVERCAALTAAPAKEAQADVRARALIADVMQQWANIGWPEDKERIAKLAEALALLGGDPALASAQPVEFCERDPKCVWPKGHAGDAHCHTVGAPPPQPAEQEATSPSPEHIRQLLKEGEAIARDAAAATLSMRGPVPNVRIGSGSPSAAQPAQEAQRGDNCECGHPRYSDRCLHAPEHAEPAEPDAEKAEGQTYFQAALDAAYTQPAEGEAKPDLRLSLARKYGHLNEGTEAAAKPEAETGREVRHPIDCAKVEHIGKGHLHGEDYEGPYDVDGVAYCGRCHTVLP